MSKQHDYYKNGDSGAPDAITDGHGDVVLALCRVCGQAEAELEETCPGPKAKADKQRAARKVHPKITMGCVAAILGVSKSMTRKQVIRQMVREYHNAESEYVANIAAEYNDKMRQAAEVAFENQFKRNIIKVDIAKPLSKIMSSHPSMARSDQFEGMGLVFIRTPFGQRDIADKRDFKSLDDQPHMYAQMQIEMHLAGAKWGVFFQWAVCAQTAKVVHLDPEFVDRCMQQLGEFYEGVYKPETKNKDHLAPLLKEIDNERVRQMIQEYDDQAVIETNAKARKAEILEELKKAAKNDSAMLSGRKLLRIPTEGSISYSKAVKELLPDADLSKYRGAPSEKWTFE